MNDIDLEFYRNLLKQKSGLSLGKDKVYLLESRLQPLSHKWGFGSMEMLTETLRSRPDPKLVADVVDAMTTNETLFFRDDKPFRYFSTNVLPALLKARQSVKKLRIWSAACSTGQEPYSIAMTLTDMLKGQPGWTIEIVGTDISDVALKQARDGIYSQFEIQRGLPVHMLLGNFNKVGSEWQIKDNFRQMVKFESFNLLDFKGKFGMFDIIFCRNVLIYFDEETKKSVLGGLSKQLASDGCLFLGGSETVIGLAQDLKPVSECSGLYTHPGNPYFISDKKPGTMPPPLASSASATMTK